MRENALLCLYFGPRPKPRENVIDSGRQVRAQCASGSASSGLWACASRDKGLSGGSHLQSSKHEHEFRDSACVFEYFLVFLQHRVRMSFSCLPSRPPMYWGVSYGGVLLGLAGAGIGGQRAVVLPRLSGAPERALYGS